MESYVWPYTMIIFSCLNDVESMKHDKFGIGMSGIFLCFLELYCLLFVENSTDSLFLYRISSYSTHTLFPVRAVCYMHVSVVEMVTIS